MYQKVMLHKFRLRKRLSRVFHPDNHVLHRRLVRSLWVASAFFVVLAIAVYYQQGAIGFAYDRPYRKDVQKYQTWILQEKERLLQSAQALAADQDISERVHSRDVPTLKNLLMNEQARLGVSGIAAIDQDGVALSRTGVPGARGDVVFQSTAWGRRVALGQPLTTIETGTGYPLILIGAAPILVQGQVKGAIGVADFFDEEFLVHSVSPHLPRGSLIVAYTPTDGYLASNVTDPAQVKLLREYFTPGSDWVRHEQASTLFDISGSQYVGVNLVAPGLETSPGGVVLFFPFHQIGRSILLSLPGLALTITLILNLLVQSRKNFHRYWAWAIVAGVLVSLLRIALTNYFPNRNAQSIAQPPFTIYNSVLSIDPATRVFEQTYEQRAVVRLLTGGETINAVQVRIDFDPKLVTVTQLSTANSLCSPDLIVENRIDPRGYISLICGVKSPGFSGPSGAVAEIVFQPKQAGTAIFHFAPATSVHASDGLGTNVLRTTTDGAYTIVPTVRANEVRGAVVTSPSHPNPNQWYNAADVRFSWTTTATTALFAFDRLPTTIPTGTQAITTRAVRFHVSGDGAYYFHLTTLVGSRVGPTVHRRVMVDATPPEALSILTSDTKVRRGAILRVQLQALDQLSGLQRTFYLKIDRGTFLPVGSNVDVTFEKAGTHKLTLRAFDNAGNYAEASTHVQVRK